jgi:hypothetical protein
VTPNKGGKPVPQWAKNCVYGGATGGGAYLAGLKIAMKAADFDPVTAIFSVAAGCAFSQWAP